MREQINPQSCKSSENLNKCRFCGSKNYTKQGYRKTKLRGKIQKYYCNDCKKYFVIDDGFYRMRFNPKTISMCIDFFLSNLSSRKLRNQLKRHFGYHISHQTILEWVRKYVLKVHKFVEKLSYNLGDKFYADETYINRKGNQDRFWACIDYKTRFITGVHYSLDGNCEEALEFIKKSVSKGKPKSIKTDSANFYPYAFRRMFYSNKLKGLSVEHRIQNVFKTKIHNYKIETVFSKLKDRIKGFRSLKSLSSAPLLLLGLVIQHNFIEEHTTTHKVPSELAGVNLSLKDDRWLELIKLSY